ncbi:MAG: glucosamine-6-phosphate deaminase [Bryobacteraceae bacterium]|nr:glucosamine-6-phosphate deaminase [Bryobacteraceae bacterium]
MNVRVFRSRFEMGHASGEAGAQALAHLIAEHGRTAAVFASAASQIEFLQSLAASDLVDWKKVTAFHLDEYIGMPASHPASFRRFLYDCLWSRVTPAAFYELAGDAEDIHGEIQRYSELLDREKPRIGFLGIGENGHLAFNDPPANFEDQQTVRAVHLDEVCRMQQVHDGAFAEIKDVPLNALTMTIPAIHRIPQLIVNVPGKKKAEAVRRALRDPISRDCPASILQQHGDTTLFLDTDSARLL